MQGIEGDKRRRWLRRRHRQADAIGQRRAAEKRNGCADGAVGIADKAVAEPATGAVGRRDRRRAMALQQRSEILRMDMAVAGDELNHHRQQREPLRRAAEVSPPDGDTIKHRLQA